MEKMDLGDVSRGRVALVEAGDLIYQEVYRFGVEQKAPDEVKAIKGMHSNILASLKQFDYVYDPEHIEDMAFLALDMIVLGCAEDIYIEEMIQGITVQHFADIEFHSLMDGQSAEDEQQQNIYRETLRELVKLHKQYSEFRTNIDHRYQPRLLVCDQDYEIALSYFYNEDYLIKKDIEEGNHTFITVQQPFQTFRPYNKRNILNFDYLIDDQQISNNAISKRMKSGEKLRIEVDDKDKLQSYTELTFYADQDTCSITRNLRIDVDLTSALSERELEQTVAKFRNAICGAQLNNRICSMLLATKEKELIDAYLQPRLNHVPISELMEIFSSGLSGNLSFIKVKQFLCGMILYKARWMQPNQEDTVLVLSHAIAERLTRSHGKGFSVQSIDRGYQEVNRLLKKQLKESNFLAE